MKYRIKDRAPQHYVDGRLYGPGEIVEYPDAMKPGMWLELIESPKVTEESTPVDLPKRRKKK